MMTTLSVGLLVPGRTRSQPLNFYLHCAVDVCEDVLTNENGVRLLSACGLVI